MKFLHIPNILIIFIFFLLPIPSRGDTEEIPRTVAPSEVPSTFYGSDIPYRRPKKKIVGHFSSSVHSDFFSRYVWRGLASSLGPVWQPSVTLEFYGVGLGAWANFVLSDEPNQGQFNEVDLTLSYHREIRRLSVSTWLVLELFPNGDPASLNFSPTTLEYDLYLAHPVGPIHFFTDFSVLLVPVAGAIYWDLGIGYERNLGLNFKIKTSALFGMGDGRFNKFYIADVGTKANLFDYSLAFPWNPLKHWEFVPAMHVSVILAPSLREVLADPTIVWGGLSVNYSL